MYPRRQSNSYQPKRNSRFDFAREQQFSPIASRLNTNLQVPVRNNIGAGASERLHALKSDIESTAQPAPHQDHPVAPVKPFIMPELHLEHPYTHNRQAMDIVAPYPAALPPQNTGPLQENPVSIPHTPPPPPSTPPGYGLPQEPVRPVQQPVQPVVQQLPAQPAQPAPPILPQAQQPMQAAPPQTSTPLQANAPQYSPDPTLIDPLAAPLPEENAPAQTQSSAVADLLKILRGIGGVVLFIVIVIGGASLLNMYVFQSYYVDGMSMQPTLHDEDRLIVSKVERTTASATGGTYIPERGQIVVIDSTDPSIDRIAEQKIIKRVIGLPGETVAIQDGTVTVFNAESPGGFNVDTLLGLNVGPTYNVENIHVTIPQGSVYVLGDNRLEGGSFDSRAFGPISTDLIEGRLFMRILPLSDVGVF